MGCIRKRKRGRSEGKRFTPHAQKCTTNFKLNSMKDVSSIEICSFHVISNDAVVCGGENFDRPLLDGDAWSKEEDKLPANCSADRNPL